MSQPKKKARKNLYMSAELANWYEDEAENIGVTHTALMVLALQHYRDYRKSLEFSKSFESLRELIGIDEM